MRRLMGCVAVLGALCAVHGGSASAAANSNGLTVLLVPDDFATIQAALDAAPKNSETTILVSPGTYRESLVISGFFHLTVAGRPRAQLVSAGGEPAISICTSNQVTVSDLDVASDASGVQVYDTVAAHLSGLVIDRPAGYGVLVEGSSEAALTLAGFHQGHMEVGMPNTVFRTQATISETTISGSGADAVRVGTHAFVGIGMSRIVAPHGDGVHAEGAPEDGSEVDLADSSITGAEDDGIDASGLFVVAVRSQISGTGNAGIVLTGDARAVVERMDVRDTGGHGIETLGTGRADYVVSSTVTNAGGDGIRVTSPTVSSNTVSGTLGAGITLLGPVTSVEGNVVGGAGGDGIVLLSGGIRGANVRNNVVEEAAGDGIDAGSASRVTFAGNSVTGAGDCGFRFDADSLHNRLQRNKATDSAVWDLWDDSRPGTNAIAKSNRFRTQHRRHRHHGR